MPITEAELNPFEWFVSPGNGGYSIYEYGKGARVVFMLNQYEAEEIVSRHNAAIRGLQAQLEAKPQRKSKKKQVEEALRESDLSAQLSGRDNIDYGHHETLPRGEHVAREGFQVNG